MSAISLKSITGITSITTPAGVDNQLTLHTNDTTQRVKITQSGIEAVGVATFQDIDVDGHTNLDNVSIAGVSTLGGSIQDSVKILHNSGYGLRVERGGKYLDFNGDWGASGSTALNAGSSGIRLYYGDSSDGIQFNTGSGVDKVRITGSGNVGINSTAPRGKLDIKFAGAPNFITFGSDADNPKMEWFRSTGGSPSHYATEIQMVLGDLVLSTAATANLGSHSYSEKLRINSGGRVIIGHSQASGDLHGPQGTTGRNPFIQLHGTNTSNAGLGLISWKNSAGAYYAPSLFLAHSGSDTKGTNGILPANGEFGSIVFSGDDGTDFVKGAMIKARLDGSPGNDNMPGMLQFYTNSGSDSPTERLLIDHVGNITFTGTTGNSSPRITIKHSNADVEGEVIRFARTDLPTIRYHSIKAKHSGNSTLNFVTFNVHDGGSSPYITQAEVLRLRGDGKVGIGTATPSKSLHVDGTIFASGATTSLDGGLRIQPNNDGTNYGGVIYGGAHNDNNTAIYMRRGADGGNNTIDINSYGMFRVFTGGALASQGERLRITSDGDMGLGTGSNAVTQRLDVRESSSTVFNASSNLPTIARLYNTSSTNGASAGLQLRTDNNNGAAAIQYIHAVNSSTNYSSDLVFSRRLATSGTYAEQCRITNAGNLRFQANRGVEFHNYGTGTDIDNNILDDYEEGTFTPIMYGNTTGGSSNTVSGTGTYTKVGDICTITVNFANKNGTGLPANEQMRIAGIPFTFANGPGNQTSAVPFTYNVAFNTSHVYMFIGGNSLSFLRGYNSRDSATWQPWMTASWRVSQFYLIVNMTYKTA